MRKSDCGLTEDTVLKLQRLFKTFPEIHSVKIFGSRALGTYKEGSDIDVAIFGPQVTPQILRSIAIAYHNLNLPYHLDLIHYESISNPALRVHIDQHGVCLDRPFSKQCSQ